MEKKLEIWLKDEKYQDLISVRKNNRIYFESKFLKVIENELYYEELYKEKGKIEKNDIDISKIKPITQYDISNVVNCLLMYPFANILSDYLVDSDLLQNDNKLVEICLNMNLYEILKDYSIKGKYKKIHT